MKNSTIVSAVLGLALSLAVGCAKSTDLGKMQEETIATVKMYTVELDVLQRRYDALEAVKSRSEAVAANAMLEKAGAAITAARTKAAAAPTSVAAAAKSGKPEALTQEHYAILQEIELNIEIAKDNLAGYETYVSSVAYASTKPAAVPPTGEPKPDTANTGSGTTTPPGHTSDLPCSAEILLQCPEGQIDACMKSPTAATHGCVPK